MPSLEQLGERAAIRSLVRVLEPAPGLGIGDDCAVLPWGSRYLLLTTDVLNAQTHFPEGTRPFEMGWHAVAVSLSDLAAMGGEPLGVVVAESLPRTTSHGFLRALTRGMNACARAFGTHIVGGDTKEAAAVSLAGTALGWVPRCELLTRRGARAGDLVAVTGRLGGAALGLRSIQHGLGLRPAEARWRRPTPRLREGRMLARSSLVTSCLDLSDGLSSGLHELCRWSKVGMAVDEARLPIFPALRRASLSSRERRALLLHGGQDYELLVTLRSKASSALHRLARQLRPTPLTVVGKVQVGGGPLVVRHGRAEALPDAGYEHFRG